MKIKMTEDFLGSPNGYSVKEYNKDNEYDVPEELGKVFVKLGKAKKMSEEKIENKMVEPEYNKSEQNEDIEKKGLFKNKK